VDQRMLLGGDDDSVRAQLRRDPQITEAGLQLCFAAAVEAGQEFERSATQVVRIARQERSCI